MLVSRQDKANLFFHTFKSGMGSSMEANMAFDLSDFFGRTIDLSYLVDPFSTQEIDDLVKRMSADKALGPDGFNGLFFEKMLAHCSPRFLQVNGSFSCWLH